MRSSQACLELIPDGVNLAEFDAFAADLGPGSFTGVRVGIVLAKTFAYLHGKPCIGADAFDLIDATRTVAFPSKRGEFFVRRIGTQIERTTEVPDKAIGFGFEGGDSYPHAGGFAQIDSLELVTPEEFAPRYLLEPSISTPKKPYAGGAQ